MRIRQIIAPILAASLLVTAAPLGATAAPRTAGVTAASARWNTFDWVLFEGAWQAAAWDCEWLDRTAAHAACSLPATSSPDAARETTPACAPTDPAHAAADLALARLVDDAATAYAAGDFERASRDAGHAAHMLVALSDPLFANGVAATDPAAVAYRDWAGLQTDSALERHGWVTPRAPRLVDDPAAAGRALRASAAALAPRTLAYSRALAGGQRMPLQAARDLAARLDAAAGLMCDLLLTIEARAQREVVPQARLAGADRYGTALAVSREAFPAGASSVVVASGVRWPDALTASSLAGILGAPVLLAPRDTLPADVRAEIARLGATRAYVVGGEAAVGGGVASAIDAIPGVGVERIAGADRYATAERVAARACALRGSPPSEVLVCTGRGYADALAVSQIAARRASPVLLADPARPANGPAGTARSLGVYRAYVIGGTLAVPAAVESALVAALGRANVSRVAGADRLATGVAVLDLADSLRGAPAPAIWLASARAFPDGLSAGPAAAQRDGALLLTDPVRLSPAVADALRARRAHAASLTIAGGTAALGPFVGADAQRALDPSPSVPPAYPPWEPAVNYPLTHAGSVTSRELDHYYYYHGWSYSLMKSLPRDRNGIVMVDYGGRTEYNPTTVALFAVANHELYLHSGTATSQAEFLRHARWLRDNTDSQGRLCYRFDLPARLLRAPWVSAMAQGFAISAMLRAYQMTGDASYRAAAERAYLPFGRTVEAGGVVSYSRSDLWLEEYPQRPPTQVLNGSIYAMWGLWDLYRVTGRADVRGTFEQAASTLARNLDTYEQGGYVLYERVPGHYSAGYHSLQIWQLRTLTAITGDRRFADRADRWDLVPGSPSMSVAAAAETAPWTAAGASECSELAVGAAAP